LLVDCYMLPMQVESMVKKNFTEHDIAVVFSCINTILSVSKELLVELESRLEKWPAIQLFGEVFIKMAPVLKLYVEYINNYDQAQAQLKLLMETPEGEGFFTDCKQKSGSPLDILSLHIMPVQRLPRYELLLKELLRFTEENHEDYSNLTQALEDIKKVNCYINEKKKNVDSRQKLTSLQGSIKNCPGDVVQAYRYYLREGLLQVISAKKEENGVFYLFLLNDIMIFTKKRRNARQPFKYQFMMVLGKAHLQEVAEPTMFRILSGNLHDVDFETYTFCATSVPEKQAWIRDLLQTPIVSTKESSSEDKTTFQRC